MRLRQPSAILGSFSILAVFLVIYLTVDRFEEKDEQEITLEKKHLELKLMNLAEELTVRYFIQASHLSYIFFSSSAESSSKI